MKIVAHRINKISTLKRLPKKYGCEIDIRSQGSQLILNHEPYESGDGLLDYLDNYNHGLLVLNIKEAGIENDVLNAVRIRGLSSFFLLDVEFPYLYNASRLGERSIAVRFSEDEPIDLIKTYSKLVDWVWIDTNTRLPLTGTNIKLLSSMQSCLVCPERWGRPQDIIIYRQIIQKLQFNLNAVMTNQKYLSLWEKQI
tara:strand:+ start:98 stop:688 length:591 start_codon:yes stop_codon:yes gene_type:complete